MMTGMAAVAMGMVATVLSLFLAGIAYGHHRRQSLRFWRLEKRLPDAVRYEDLQSRVAALEAEHESLRDRLFDANETLNEAARKQEWMETIREEIASLEQQREEVARIQNELETKQVTLAELHEQLLREETACREAKKTVEQLRDDEHKLTKQLEELRGEKDKLEAIKREVADLEKAKARAEEEIEKVKKRGDELREDLELELRRQKASQEAELAELKRLADQEIADLEKAKAHALEEIEKVKKKGAELREDLELELRRQKASQEAELAELKRLADQEIANQAQEAKRQKAELQSELDALRRQRDLAAEEQEARQKQVDDFEQRLADLRKEQQELKQQRKQLNNEVSELEGRRSALQGQIPTLESAFSQLSSSLERHSAGPDLAKSELWSPVLNSGSEKPACPSERDALEAVSTALTERGLRFDARTLHAFHTALKSTGSSPLVTLAGVSGTGKSELPRCYADALGINFLGLAVQPRWDSPQDLFGFYDYLEQRFRPTELTRALLQMDPIGPQQGRGWGCPDEYADALLEGQMLLVLLDEMNLARVEYYFSEFLSKLETRRGIDWNNAGQRQRAEIVLDVSGRTSAQQPLRLFVGQNVLFVGTMNEDESTQALSDKVIDRSNVLRFGSPREVTPLHARNGAARAGDRLLHEHWKSWCKTMHDLSDNDKDRLLKWVQRIRGALDGVGRPFAYRVANAILEYAANYPDVRNRIEYALADQIEQRVLPKLIGLDMHQPGSAKALNEISAVLDELEDANLKEQLARNQREDYFQWTGLDRTAL
ncbi:AAA family ATPase [Botrimarina hoheduenensis]|uniref:Chromosome partition protein Smc n=1 Tax=Botrimarina hoheduenensis TaxID=2528000 RepID=A0A5C5WGR6_9BACT|nr:AAA family ATPase [Botrimarina hoheduenensis]TWT48982.1 Chromosome partition protein Smc [Botrimarina hoheduenensis]